MAEKTLKDLAKAMKDIDFTMLVTQGEDGTLSGRPMSNNRDVEYDGDSFYFTWEDSDMVADIEDDPKVELSFQGKAGLLGKPPIFISVEGEAEIVRDKAAFAEHWNKDLDRWFEKGVDTPGVVMLKIHADLVRYWDGEDQGEVVP